MSNIQENNEVTMQNTNEFLNELNNEEMNEEEYNELIDKFNQIENGLNESKEIIIECANKFLNEELCLPYDPKSYIDFLNIIVDKINKGIKSKKEDVIIKREFIKYQQKPENNKEDKIPLISYKHSYVYYFDEDVDKEFPFYIDVILDNDDENQFNYIFKGFDGLVSFNNISKYPSVSEEIIRNSISKSIAEIYRDIKNNKEDIDEELLNKYINKKFFDFVNKYLYMRDDGNDIKEIIIPVKTHNYIIRYKYKIQRYINIATEVKKYIIIDEQHNRQLEIKSTNDLNEAQLKKFILSTFYVID